MGKPVHPLPPQERPLYLEHEYDESSDRKRIGISAIIAGALVVFGILLLLELGRRGGS